MPKIKKPRLVSDWRKCLTWISIQLQIVLAAGTGAWMTASDGDRSAVLAMLGLSDPGWLLLAGIGATIVGRLISQNGAGNEAP